MSNTKRNTVGSIVALIVSGAIIAFSAWLFLNRQFVIDQMSVWSFEPSAEIMAIEARSEMTEQGRFIFYATKPEVLEASNFNNECPRQEVGNPILGCYTSSDRIYIYNLTDMRLDGMKEITAAHEMLHAVWQRMDESEKQRVTALLEAEYQKINDPELKLRMDYYQRTEPGQLSNELHSILGTEVSGLAPELESYYAQYFDRETILALHGIYDVFYTGLSTEAQDLFGKMEALAASIDEQSKAYDQEATQLTADINDFNARANAGSFSSASQFNAERAALVNRSNSLEAQRNAINSDIAIYNTYYAKYQEIAEQLQLLNDSMDSYNSIDEGPSV